MEHLKDHTYYSELYDKFTIEKCQRWEKSEDLESLKDENEAVAKIKKDFKKIKKDVLAFSILEAESLADVKKILNGLIAEKMVK